MIGIIASSIQFPSEDHFTNLTLSRSGAGSAGMNLKFNKPTTVVLSNGTWGSTGTASKTFAANVQSDDTINYTDQTSFNVSSDGLTYLYNYQDDLSGDISQFVNLEYILVNGNSSAGKNKLTGSISNLLKLEYVFITGLNKLTGSMANLINLSYFAIKGNSTIEPIETIINHKRLCSLYAAPNLKVNVDQILADLIVNKDEPKTRIERQISLADNPKNYALGQGMIDAEFLRNYATPNNPPGAGPTEKWWITLAGTPTAYAEWHGAVDTNWNNPANWLNGVTPAAGYIQILKDTPHEPQVHNLVLLEHLYVDGKLSISGELKRAPGYVGVIVCDGTLDADGTIEFNGTSLQNVDGALFEDRKVKRLRISNDVKIETALYVQRRLDFGAVSNKTLNANGQLVLLSTATETANVGKVLGGNAIMGDVEVQRYLPVPQRGWNSLSVATYGPQNIFDAWQEGASGETSGSYGNIQHKGVHLTSPQGIPGGFDSSSPAPSIKLYVAETGKWSALDSRGTLRPFEPMTDGFYFVYVRGDRNWNPSDGINQPLTWTVLRTKGHLYQGDVKTFNITVPEGKPSYAFSINNFFASTIDLRELSRDALVKFEVWDMTANSGAGSYVFLSYDAVNDTYVPDNVTGAYAPSKNKNPNLIRSGEGVWVVTTKDVELNFAENIKSDVVL